MQAQWCALCGRLKRSSFNDPLCHLPQSSCPTRSPVLLRRVPMSVVNSSPPSSPISLADSQATTAPGMPPLRSRTRSRTRSPSLAPTLELPSPPLTPTLVTHSPVRASALAVTLPPPAIDLPPSPAAVPVDSISDGLDDTNQRDIVALMYDSPPRPPPSPPPRSVPVTYVPSPLWQNAPYETSTFFRARFQLMSEAIDRERDIFWMAGGSKPAGTPLNIVLADIINYFELMMRGLGKYYIGVTMDPRDRFLGRTRGPDPSNHHYRWKTMFLLAHTTGVGIKFLETGLLADPKVGVDSHRCTNKGPGGEGVAKEPNPDVPYFLYVVHGDPKVGPHNRQ